MPDFCKACRRLLKKDTSTNFIRLTCICGREYPPDPEDTKIAESYAPEDVGSVNTLLFGEQDPVACWKPITCPNCSREQMVLLESGGSYRYKCGKCKTIINGDRTLYEQI